MTEKDITALYYCIDEFRKIYETWERMRLIPRLGSRRREGKLSLSEKLFIVILFHLSGFRTFKLFYEYGLKSKYRRCFKELPSYERFVQIKKELFLPLSILMQSLVGEESGLYIADSTTLKVCHNRRINQHKVFKHLAARGKSSMGWFYGFKLHVVINDKGELMAVKITSGNTDDRSVLDKLTDSLKGKIFADKGYISKELFDSLWKRGLHLITGIKKNMKNHLMPLLDKMRLRGRFIVESVFNIMKNNMNLEHSRHRSPINFCINILAALIAYSFRKNKPSWKNLAKNKNISYP